MNRKTTCGLPAHRPHRPGVPVDEREPRRLGPPGERGRDHVGGPTPSATAPTARPPRRPAAPRPGRARASRAARSPPRDAARKASTTARERPRSPSGLAVPACTRRRARLASCLAASGERSRMAAIVVERDGEQVVQHERHPLGRASAAPGRRAAPARPTPPAPPRARDRCRPRPATGAGRESSSGSSRRDARDRSMSSATRATTVVSQPPRLATAALSERREPDPGLLDGVLGLARRAQHPVGHRPQMAAVLLELLRQYLVGRHRIPFAPPSRHRDDGSHRPRGDSGQGMPSSGR